VKELSDSLTAADDSPGPEAEQLRIALIQALGGIRSTAAAEALSKHLERRLSDAERSFAQRALAAAKGS
jgi:HEAT repeat protein